MATPPPIIDLTSLEKALAALQEGIGYWQDEPGDSGRKPHLRAGAIQSFEFTYELCMRFLRRVLIERALSADLVNDLSFDDVLPEFLEDAQALLVHLQTNVQHG